MSMQTLKPDDIIVKSLTALCIDVGKQIQVTRKHILLDQSYIMKRLNCEGVSFATKTLPKFGKHFDNALKSGQFHTFASFKRQRGSTLPCFLNGLMRKVFAVNGSLLRNPCHDSIRLVRQFSYMFYKLIADYEQALVNEVVDEFKNVDDSLQDDHFGHPESYGIIFQAQKVINNVFSGFCPMDIMPRPGPGQCASKTPHHKRYQPEVYYPHIDKVYPYRTYYYSSVSHLRARSKVCYSSPVSLTSTSKLSLVPKDSRGPRIICMEPHELMWFQQGLGRSIMDHIERQPLTKGQVNFYDQTINQKLALTSSKNKRYATLDMKEASDRISTGLVDILFDDLKPLRERLMALKSDYIELPTGELLKKKKFAPMGSALCFPIMSVVHFALAVASISMATGESHRAIAKHVYVYGDDIIVKTHHAKHLLDTFPIYNLKFNVDKSCLTGGFRESCGVDAYDGTDVTPQRIKKCVFSKNNADDLLSSVAIFHGLFNRGLWETARIWREEIERTYGSLPCVSKTSATAGWIVPRDQVLNANEHWHYDKKLQTPYIWNRIFVSRSHNVKSFQPEERLLRALIHTHSNSASFSRRDTLKIKMARIPLSSV